MARTRKKLADDIVDSPARQHLKKKLGEKRLQEIEQSFLNQIGPIAEKIVDSPARKKQRKKIGKA